MPTIRIHSIDDPRISVYRDLPNSSPRSREDRFIAEGRHLVERLLESRFVTESVLTTESQLHRVQPLVPPDVSILVADNRLISEIVGFRFHRGMLACGLRQPYAALSDVVPPAPTPATVLLLSRIRDQENLGAIFRAAAAFDVCAVVVGPHCADPLARRVLRVSMGAVLKLSLTLSDDLSREVDWLQEQARVDVLATVLDPAAEPLAQADCGNRIALLLGSEDSGLPVELAQRCRRRVTIPMHLETDSLNVAMASGIFLYHFTRPER